MMKIAEYLGGTPPHTAPRDTHRRPRRAPWLRFSDQSRER